MIWTEHSRAYWEQNTNSRLFIGAQWTRPFGQPSRTGRNGEGS